jgi:hypothetical protein
MNIKKIFSKSNTHNVVVTSYNQESRCIYFVSDRDAAKELGYLGKVTANYREHETNDIHWILGVSRLHSFVSVLEDMQNTDMNRLFGVEK